MYIIIIYYIYAHTEFQKRPSPLVSALGRPRLAVRGPPGGRCSARGAEKRAATLLRRGRDQENRGTGIFNILYP